MSELCKHEHTGSRRIGGVLKEVTCTKCGTVVWNEELSRLRAENELLKEALDEIRSRTGRQVILGIIDAAFAGKKSW